MDFRSNIRLFITYIIVLISVTFGVVTVFSTDLIFIPQVNNSSLLSKNIFLDDRKMQSTYVFFSSNSDLSAYDLSSSCNINSKFFWEKDNAYAFKITFLEKCSNPIVFLQTKEKIFIKNSVIKLNLFNKSELFEIFTDKNSKDLENTYKIVKKNIFELKFKSKKKSLGLEKLQLERKILEFEYQGKFLKEIIDSRKLKYIVPVSWHKISEKKNEIPNSGRPYRQTYTDWIHHGWDIVAPNNTPVIALDNSKVIKIVRGFVFSDLSKMKRAWNITEEDKHINLDILRWNQVWLKTSKWDVVFYSHLSKVSDIIKVWDIISRWDYLWNIWITWVPDRNYKNYHLHFSVMKNPYIKSKVWKYSLIDYMKWDWYFKWKSLDYVIENQKNIFN